MASGGRRGHVGLTARAQDDAVDGVDNQGPGQQDQDAEDQSG